MSPAKRSPAKKSGDEIKTTVVPRDETNWPEWFEKGVAAPFGAGVSHTFILHGDINGLTQNADYQNPDAEDKDVKYLKLELFLRKIFSGRQMVMFYNLASGLYFLDGEMMELFRQITGLDSADDDGPADPKVDPAIAKAVATAKKKAAKKKKIPTDPVSCFSLIDTVFRRTRESVLIIRSAHVLMPQGGGGGGFLSPEEKTTVEQLKNWAQSVTLRGNRTLILMTTDSATKMSAELRSGGSGVQVVSIPKPNDETRKRFLDLSVVSPVVGADEKEKIGARVKELRRQYVDLEEDDEEARGIREELQSLKKRLSGKADGDDRIVLASGVDLNNLVLATQGMSLSQINEMLLMVRAEKKSVDLLAMKAKKRDMLNSEHGDLLRVIEPSHTMDDIGGRQHVKDYFNFVLRAIKSGKKNLVPMGIMLMGPPGTGKTIFVEALAGGADWNFVEQMNTRSMWVGESEAKQERLIQALWDLAPVVVLKDEADLSDASRDSYKGDSGVSERMMQSWMKFLSNPKVRGRVLVISCTNRPDKMDPALKRSGRSDDRIFIPVASATERADIFCVIFRHSKVPTTIKDFSKFSAKTGLFSGADIEKTVLSSQKIAFEDGKEEVEGKHLEAAIDDFIPTANQAENDAMSLVCITESSSRRMLPPNINEIVRDIVARNMVPNIETYLAKIRANNIVDLKEALRERPIR